MPLLVKLYLIFCYFENWGMRERNNLWISCIHYKTVLNGCLAFFSRHLFNKTGKGIAGQLGLELIKKFFTLFYGKIEMGGILNLVHLKEVIGKKALICNRI